MRIVVTGGAGFIGSHLCATLVGQGHEVTCFDSLFTGSKLNLEYAMADGRMLIQHPLFEFVRGDVCEPFHIECDRVYHLACPASPVHYQRVPVRTLKTAFVGTMHALECARDAGARTLIASTSEVYGNPLVHPQPEDYWGHVNPVGRRACYDEGKRAAEALAVTTAEHYGTDVRIARIFNTYGPRMRSDDGRLIPNFITAALHDRPLIVYGEGKQTRSFCYVDDTVRGLIALMEATASDAWVPIINIGNPEERTVYDVAEWVIRKVGRGFVSMGPMPPDDPERRCPDITRAKRLLSWEPRVSFSEGLDHTVEWHRGRSV